MSLRSFDITLIHFFRKVSVPFARLSLFVVFFWFGSLKVIGLSPASGLVARLFEETIVFMSPSVFVVVLGIFEVILGILFLIKGAERIVIPILFIHMFTTFGPLLFLPQETWSGFLIPTLEGQYIIKNLVIIAGGIVIVAHLHPIHKK